MKGAKGVIRGETWRWKKWISWGRGEGGSGSTCVAGDADGFEVGHFGCRIRCRVSDGSFEEGDSVGRIRGKVLIECTIRLKTNCAEVRCVATGQNSNRNIGRLWQGGDGVWKEGDPLREDDPGADHCGLRVCVGGIPSNHSHRSVFVGIA